MNFEQIAELPSVTDITRVLKTNYDDPFFQTGYGKAIMRNAQRIGNAGHKMAELKANDELDDSQFDDDTRERFESLRKWMDENIVTVIAAETVVWSKLGYRGTPDLIAILKGDSFPTLTDYKFSDTVEEWYVRFQTAAYVRAAIEQGILAKPCRRLSVKIIKGRKKPKVDEFSISSYLTDLTGFQYCLYLKKITGEKQ